MRKVLTVALAFVMLVSFAPRAHSIGAFLSWWNGNDTDNGFGIGANHQIQIIPLVGADVRASWLNFSDKDFNMFPLEGVGYVSLDVMLASNTKARAGDVGTPPEPGIDPDEEITIVNPTHAESVLMLCSWECWKKVREHIEALVGGGA